MSDRVVIAPQDLVTDSESSSSENESLTSSTSSSSDDDARRESDGRDEPGYPGIRKKEAKEPRFFTRNPRMCPVPRKVERLREAVFESLLCALIIIDERGARAAAIAADESATQGGNDTSRPKGENRSWTRDFWSRMVQRVPEICTGLGAFQSDLPSPIGKVLALLIIVLDEGLVALPDDKAYLRRDLNKREAAAARAFARRWTGWRAEIISHFTLDGTLDVDNSRPLLDRQAAKAIRQVHHAFLLRVAYCALQLPARLRRLDLSNLRMIPMEVWQATDFSCLTTTLGFDASTVDYLALSRNGFKRFPDWRTWPFPALGVLDVTSNPLDALPIGLLSLRRLRQVSCDDALNAVAAKRSPVIKSGSLARLQDLIKRNQGPPRSLVDRCIAVLLQYDALSDELDSVPPYLADLVRWSFHCELCQTLCVPSSANQKSGHALWLGNEVSTTWQMPVFDRRPNSIVPIERIRHVPIRGRICQVCQLNLRHVEENRGTW